MRGTRRDAIKHLEATFVDMVLEMPTTEVEELLREQGENPTNIRRRMRSAIERGLAYQNAADDKMKVVHDALGCLLTVKRRQAGLSIEALADHVRVAPEELRAIEMEASYTPKPRTIVQLAEFLKVPAQGLMQVFGDKPEPDEEIAQAARGFKFAACSSTNLTREERRAMEEFVALLCSRAEKSG